MGDYPLKDYAYFITYEGIAEGISIACPNCGREYSAWFDVPIGGGSPAFQRSVRWQRSGETLETLTLNPSFLAFECYHSFIRNGMLSVDSPFKCQPKAERLANEERLSKEAAEK